MKDTMIVGGTLVVILLFILIMSSGNPTNQLNVYRLNNAGCVYAVGVGVNTTRINWGQLEPNSTATHAIQVTNTGTTPAWLSYNCSNYQPPEFQQYSLLSWSYQNETLQPSQAIDILLTLEILPSIQNITDFSFDITITGNPK